MSTLPTRFGLLLYPRWELLDVGGPIEALNVLTRPEFGEGYKNFSLSIISTTLNPVPTMASGSPFQQTVTPTHTVDNAPPLDVLLVPGGLGSGDEDTNPLVEFIRDRFPSLMYLIIICTGADLAARAGVLDGLKATTNKAAWLYITQKPTSCKTYWVAHARWVECGKVWSTSGVSAGTDGVIAWIAKVYGEDLAERTVKWMEYFRNPDPHDDPFSASLHDVPPVYS